MNSINSEARTPRARTLPVQGAVNRLVRRLLRSPLAPKIGERLIELHIVGRKSGKHYDVPVAYTARDGGLMFGTPFSWGRNLHTGDAVEINFKGHRRTADVEVRSDEDGVVTDYATMCRDNRRFAKFNKIRFDATGNPDADDLHAAWAAGARSFRLTLR